MMLAFGLGGWAADAVVSGETEADVDTVQDTTAKAVGDQGDDSGAGTTAREVADAKGTETVDEDPDDDGVVDSEPKADQPPRDGKAVEVTVPESGGTDAVDPEVAEPDDGPAADDAALPDDTADDAADDAAAGAKDQARRPPPAQVTGVLPSPATELLSGRPSPASILHDYEITEDSLAASPDGKSFLEGPQGRQLLLRLLLRLRFIPQVNVEQWAKSTNDLSPLLKEPAAHRFGAFYIDGRVVMVERLSVSSAEAMRFELEEFYRCHLFVGDPELPAVVYATGIPKAWPIDEAIDERISFFGLFAKRGHGPIGVAPLVFITRRVAWHPNTLLGDLGMDMGLLDDLEQKRPLLPDERECFYRMLATVKSAGGRELLRHAHNDVVFRAKELVKEKNELQRQIDELTAQQTSEVPAATTESEQRVRELQSQQRRVELRIDNAKKRRVHEFFPLLERPDEYIGQLRVFRGTAARIVQVRVQEPDLIERFGIRKYYQIDMMVNLEGKLKVLKREPKEGESAEDAVDRVTWTHPATFCVLELPEGLPMGENVNEDLRIAGFFLKNWAYETGEFENGEPKWRYAPMLIGQKPLWHRGPTSSLNVYAGAIAGGLFVLALIGVWVGVWRITRSDQKFQKSVVSKTYAVADGVSLNELDLNVADGVDFSYLNKDPVGPDERQESGS
jgi:hypothetical protein